MARKASRKKERRIEVRKKMKDQQEEIRRKISNAEMKATPLGENHASI